MHHECIYWRTSRVLCLHAVIVLFSFEYKRLWWTYCTLQHLLTVTFPYFSFTLSDLSHICLIPFCCYRIWIAFLWHDEFNQRIMLEKVEILRLMFKEQQSGSGSWRGKEGIKEHGPSWGEGVTRIITPVTHLVVPAQQTWPPGNHI